MMEPTLSPAYGRDYKSAAAVLADWAANKDFTINGLAGGGYMNKADAIAYGFKYVRIRYNKLTLVVDVEV